MISVSCVYAADDNVSEIEDGSDSDDDTTSDESFSIDFTYDSNVDDEPEDESEDNNSVLIDFHKHPTGNPIFVILIALMSVISLSFNRRK